MLRDGSFASEIAKQDGKRDIGDGNQSGDVHARSVLARVKVAA